MNLLLIKKNTTMSDRKISQSVTEQLNKQTFLMHNSWENTLPYCIVDLLKPYSVSTGVPIEFLLFPFFTATAAMGQLSKVSSLKDSPGQPSILWTQLLALKGSEKSGSFDIIDQVMDKAQVLV